MPTSGFPVESRRTKDDFPTLGAPTRQRVGVSKSTTGIARKICSIRQLSNMAGKLAETTPPILRPTEIRSHINEKLTRNVYSQGHPHEKNSLGYKLVFPRQNF